MGRGWLGGHGEEGHRDDASDIRERCKKGEGGEGEHSADGEGQKVREREEVTV